MSVENKEGFGHENFGGVGNTYQEVATYVTSVLDKELTLPLELQEKLETFSPQTCKIISEVLLGSSERGDDRIGLDLAIEYFNQHI